MADKKEQSLSDLEKELKERRAALDDAERAESQARSRVTNALNAINETQKKIDALVSSYRTGAARDTHWGQERRRMERAP